MVQPISVFWVRKAQWPETWDIKPIRQSEDKLLTIQWLGITIQGPKPPIKWIRE